jgi:hypothetical protein
MIRKQLVAALMAAAAVLTLSLSVGVIRGQQVVPTGYTVAKPNSEISARLANLRLFTMPPAGEDHLYFEVTDVIEVPGKGEDTVHLAGTYTIRRAQPTTMDWATATIDVTMVDLDVRGRSPLFGEIHASLNPDARTLGRVGPAGGGADEVDVVPAAANGQMAQKPRPKPRPKPSPCQFAAYMRFTLPERGLVLVNKEPIQLLHKITHVPPIGQGGGTPGPVAVGFYDVRNLSGPPVVILKSVKTEIGEWVE